MSDPEAGQGVQPAAAAQRRQEMPGRELPAGSARALRPRGPHL